MCTFPKEEKSKRNIRTIAVYLPFSRKKKYDHSGKCPPPQSITLWFQVIKGAKLVMWFQVIKGTKLAMPLLGSWVGGLETWGFQYATAHQPK